jgi:putative ABC transport system permease protein
VTRAHDLLRALRHRWGSSLLVLVLATVSVAAATVGPTYNAAGRTSIVQDTFTSAAGFEQGIDATVSGPINGILPAVQSGLLTDAQTGLGGPAAEKRLFGQPIDGMVIEIGVKAPTKQITLAWRDGTCANLRILSGKCPTSTSQIMISQSLAALNNWHVGTQISARAFHGLVVTGIYAIPQVNLPYWSLTSTGFFPSEEAAEIRASTGTDAAFTTRQTLAAAPAGQQGTDTVDLQIHASAVTAADVDRLSNTSLQILNDEGLSALQVVIQTAIPTVVTNVHASWNTLSTPVLVITGELLVLTWLLLFLVVVDAVEARGGEVALARLRGYGRWRSVIVAVAEPVTVLAVALPIGALIGGLIATVMGHSLRPGTPIPLVGASWVAAALATLGGVAAVLTAARRVLRRPVVEQWRRTSRGATKRAWVIDAVLLTAAGAGLLQLSVAGAFATTGNGAGSHDSLVLLVPALIGVAVAVVSSRLLPLACRAAFGFTRRSGSLASFLAVRHVARRPGGTRTVIVLVTAFTLATFATESFWIAHTNRHRVAAVATGAGTVFTVQQVSAQRLVNAVDKADPSGKKASAVLAYYGGTTSLLAVQPRRFAQVAAWTAAGAPQRGGLADLAPRVAPPIVLNGDAVRVQLGVGALNSPARLGLDFAVPGGDPPTPVDMGGLARNFDHVTLTAPISRCPCMLADVDLAPVKVSTALQGSIQIESVSVRSNGTWQPVPAATVTSQWHPAGAGDSVTSAGNSGTILGWSFTTPPTNDTLLYVADHPSPLPVIISKPLLSAPVGLVGLDGASLPFRDVQTVPAVPGQAAAGVVVDLPYAERSALNGDAAAVRQVWVAPGAASAIAASLKSQGIRVLATLRTSDAEALLLREGPGLAGSLFLLDAGAAALLAALGAVVSLAVSARRRRYEYAALAAGGVSQRILRRSLAIEQLLVLVTGAVVGVVTGIVATIVAVRAVPEFVTRPIAPALSYAPSVSVSASVLIGSIAVLFVIALVASRELLRAARPSLLREPPA